MFISYLHIFIFNSSSIFINHRLHGLNGLNLCHLRNLWSATKSVSSVQSVVSLQNQCHLRNLWLFLYVNHCFTAVVDIQALGGRLAAELAPVQRVPGCLIRPIGPIGPIGPISLISPIGLNFPDSRTLFAEVNVNQLGGKAAVAVRLHPEVGAEAAQDARVLRVAYLAAAAHEQDAVDVAVVDILRRSLILRASATPREI